MSTADAIVRTLESPNVSDRNMEPANMVDALDSLARSARLIASAVTDTAAPGTDAAGGTVGCLTEAVMGVTSGLVRIAEAISDLAEAVRDVASTRDQQESR